VGAEAPHDQDCQAAAALERTLEFALPAVEIEVPHRLPPAGSATVELRVISQRSGVNRMELELAAPGGTAYDLPLRLNRPGVRAQGAEISENLLRVRFPSGSGFQRISVTFSW
jgi:hypothetical protein